MKACDLAPGVVIDDPVAYSGPLEVRSVALTESGRYCQVAATDPAGETVWLTFGVDDVIEPGRGVVA